MHLDDALKVIGEFGRYQKTRLLLLCGFAVVSAWHALNMVFVGAEPRFHCSTHDVNTTRFNFSQSQLQEMLIPAPADTQCYRLNPDEALPELVGNASDVNVTGIGRESCPAGYVFYTDQYDSTITSDFELVCDRKFWRSTSRSVFFAGRLVGAVIFGQLSDRFGRRPLFFVGVAMLVVAGGVASAAPSMLVFLPMYFLQGAAHTGAFLVSFTLSTELVGPKYRVIAGFVIQSFYSVGFMSLAGIAYFIRDWRYLEIAITAPAVLFVVYWWFLSESIRWLLSHNEEERARQVLTEAARINGREVPPELLKELQSDPAMKATRQYTVLDCVRTPAMAKLSLNVWFNWLVNALVYYGLSLNTENLAGSPYLNFCLAGAVEIPAYLLCIVLLNRVGRRLPLIVTMYLGGLACILSGVIPKHTEALQTATIVLAMVGKFGITASYGIIYLAAAEVFPTVVRNIGMGVSSMSARIGGILAPIILESASVLPVLPMLLFGSLSVLAATLAFLLPETAGRPLPQLLENVDIGRGCASSFCCGKSDKAEITVDNDIPLKDGKGKNGNSV
ncbi:organic cation transporter protein-like [Littorina saxatilis]|uniref:Major facilitator superfamily (MFS) profile domain-containing protein n=1 Tax=Littorina saxatilis TaxID=31220 RepID=A0AAN9GHY3_9CAEN